MPQLPKAIERALERGWSIIPLKHDKRPAVSKWKQYQTRRPTREEVAAWHVTLKPPAWGVICGAISDLVILDGDGAEGVATLEREGARAHVRTASDGRHAYCKHPGEPVPSLNTKACKPLREAFPSMDIRGDGGYAVFCGTVTNKAGQPGAYKWIQTLEAEPPAMPAAVLEWIRQYARKEAPAPIAAASANGNGQHPHTGSRAEAGWLIDQALALVAQRNGRNKTGFWLALQLRDNDYSESEAAGVLEQYAARVPITNTEGHRDPYRAHEWQASLRQAYASPKRPPIERGYGRTPEPPAAGHPPAALPARTPAVMPPATPAAESSDAPAAPSPEPDEDDEAAGPPPDAPPGAGERKREPRLDDIGNAERFAARHGRDVRYCEQLGQWFVWDGRRYAQDKTLQIIERAKVTARAIYAEVARARNDEQKDEILKHAARTANRSKLLAMVDLARSLAGVAITPEDLDAAPYLLNCENGALELRTAELRPHRREDLCTKLVRAPYTPGAAAEKWRAFLERIMAGNAALIAFLQRAVGYSLTGDTSERVLFFCYGQGRNGKSTFLETIAELLGEYAAKTPSETVVLRREGGIPNDIARLKGARFVYASETQEGGRMNEEQVKNLTGERTLTARFLHKEFFEFRREFKLWLASNHKPIIRGADKGIWDRIRLIPFTVRIPDEECVPRETMDEWFRAERAGILAWAIEGARAYLAGGLDAPEEVRTATESYRSEMDVLARFIEEACIVALPNIRTRAAQLHASYQEWAKKNGERELSQTLFGTRMTERGYPKKHDRAGWFYEGIGLSCDASVTGCDECDGDTEVI